MRKSIFVFIATTAVSICSAQWVQTNGPYFGTVHAFAPSGTNLFAGTSIGVFLSTNNGASWMAVNDGLPGNQVHALAVSGTNLFAGTWGGVFLSTNNGTNWTAVNGGLTNTHVNALAVSGTNIFAGTDSGVCLSTNTGTSWTAVNNGLTIRFVWTLIVSGTNIFAGTWGGVFLSTNNGTNWTTVNNGLTTPSVNALAVSGTNIFAGTGARGVFLSTNTGTSWTAVNRGLTDTVVSALGVSGTDLFAGTNSNCAVWRRPLSQMVPVDEDLVEQPGYLSLEQNYPNPFNPSTTIRYALPRTSFVLLTVYNTLGQQVAQLVNEQQQAGDHDAVFRGDGLASGVYFYRIQAGDFVASKKLLLLK